MTSTKYHCHEAGSIPGVPGIFAGVIVEVDDATREVLGQTPIGAVVSESSVETQLTPTPLEVKASAVPSKFPKE